MRQISEEQRLPTDVEAQPLVQAAAALRPVIRGHHDEIEREQRLPKALVEQFHAAGFYRMVRPRELGGLQTDPLTYLRVVELLAEGAGSVGWNLTKEQVARLDAASPSCSHTWSQKASISAALSELEPRLQSVSHPRRARQPRRPSSC